MTTTIKARRVPEPFVIMMREKFPKLLDAVLEGENDVYLLMGPPTNKRGRPHHAVHYIASPGFLTAVPVADSGPDNLLMLIEGSFQMELWASRQGGRALK